MADFKTPFLFDYIDISQQYSFNDSASVVIKNSRNGINNFDGFGQGQLKTAVTKGLAEFLERRAFFVEILPEKALRISDFYNQISHAWAAAIDQCWNKLELTNAGYSVPCNVVFSIFNGSAQLVPNEIISLRASEEMPRVLFSDSCGNSFHTDLAAAFENSIFEFLERQNLIAYWNSARELKTFKLRHDDCNLGRFNPALKLLLEEGEIFVISTNIHFKIYSYLCLFRGKKKGCLVKFASSGAAKLCPVVGLRSALDELIGSYNFMKFHADPSNAEIKNLDEYKRTFLSFNSPETIYQFKLPKTFKKLPSTHFVAGKAYKFCETIESIANVSKNVYLFSKLAFANKLLKTGVVTKVLSPDFYLHMNQTIPSNFNNSFARLSGIAKPKMLPLPFP